MKSNKDYQKLAHELIPGGAHTYSRGDDQFPQNAPAILSKGKGCTVWDAEGNEFLDFGMGLRAFGIGYNDEQISKAAIEGILLGNNLTRASTVEVDAALLLNKLIPWCEMVKFAKNGSAVTTAAVKLARAFTGKQIILRCKQQPFHSYDDWFIGDTVMKRGVPEDIQSSTKHFDYNDLDSVSKLFIEFKGRIAGLIMEPATTEHPNEYEDGQNFLQKVQSLCREENAVFILDEVLTGFRWHLQGAAKYYNVYPDLVCYGKAMANGFSVSALGGKREIMEIGGIKHDSERVFLLSTTHGAEISGLNAFIETMKIYKENDVILHTWNFGKKLREGVEKITENLEIAEYFKIVGIDCLPGYLTLDENMNPCLKFRTLFSQEMIKNKVLMPWISICFSHTEKELEKALAAIDNSLRVYKKALEEGVGKYLVGEAVKPVFRVRN